MPYSAELTILCVRHCARWTTESLTHSFNKYVLSVSYKSSPLLVAGDEGKNETKPLPSGSLVLLEEIDSRHVNMDSL